MGSGYFFKGVSKFTPTWRGRVRCPWGKVSKLGSQSAAKVFFRTWLATGVLKAEDDAYAVGRHEGERMAVNLGSVSPLIF